MSYQLYYGDCLEILPQFPDNSFDGIVTDPPFSFAGGASNGRASITDSQFFSFWWKAVCRELERVLKPNGEGFVWCDWRSAHIFTEGFAQHQKYTWKVAQMLYHYREMPGQGQPFRSSVDMLAYVRGPKSTASRIPNTTHNFISKYWYYGKHENHPAEKDPEIAKQLLDWCSDEGMTILDPFMGSASIGEACLLKHRNFVGIELMADHFETSETRLNEIAQGFRIPGRAFNKPVISQQMTIFSCLNGRAEANNRLHATGTSGVQVQSLN